MAGLPVCAFIIFRGVAAPPVEVPVGGNQARVGKSEIAATANRVFDHVEAWTEAYGKQRVYRRVLFVRPSYWIVSDFIRADNATHTAAHTYEQVWHPEEGAEPMIDPETQRIQTRFAVGANVQGLRPKAVRQVARGSRQAG
jgi:hypothetical protein